MGHKKTNIGTVQQWCAEQHLGMRNLSIRVTDGLLPQTTTPGSTRDEKERTVHSMNVPLSNLQKLRDAIASAWTTILVEHFPDNLWNAPNNSGCSGGKGGSDPVLDGCT